VAGDEQQGVTTAETAAPAAAPTAGDGAERGPGASPEQGSERGRDAEAVGRGSGTPQARDSERQPERESASVQARDTADERERSAGRATAPADSQDGGQGDGQKGGHDAGKPAGGPSRQRNRTVRGMILSLLVIGAAVAVIYTLFIPHDDKADPVKRVDYRVELITARRAAPYPVAAPVGLPAAWKATSVTYDQADGHSWHIGFLDPAGQYVAVEQSTSPTKGYVTDVSQNAKNTGRTQQIAGARWQRWTGGRYDALVRTGDGATTVVTGTASSGDLAKMAAALRFARTQD
jgi:hypothetical protein